MKRAALIAVGSELVRFGRVDTNTLWISSELERFGVETRTRVAVSDELAALVPAIRTAIETVDLIILTGGLGPTDDDRTRDALAQALDRPLIHDKDKEAELRRRFARFEVEWTEPQARQASRPDGSAWIPNRAGSADGLVLQHDGKTLVALPGVPSEMKPMVREHLEAWVGDAGGVAIARSTMRVFGRGEAGVEALIGELYGAPGVDVTILSAPGEVHIVIRSVAATRSAAERRLEQVRTAMAQRLNNDVYVDDDRSLARIVGEQLVSRGETVAVAESCTAGALAAEITTVPGSSAWFRGGWVVYSDDVKRALAGVGPATLERHGAVSEPVARELAENVRAACATDWGIGITGIAGPDGGSRDKPVGLVHFALASSAETGHWRTVRPGDREVIRRGSVMFALDRLRRALRGAGP